MYEIRSKCRRKIVATFLQRKKRGYILKGKVSKTIVI